MTHAAPPPPPVAALPPGLARDQALGFYRQMLRIRRFEEACAEAYQREKIRGFLHLYIGEEAVAVGAMGALAPGDAVIATYREHGHALARGVPLDAVMAEMFGKVTGCSRGRGGSMHVFAAAQRFYGGNAIVGGGLPVAVGLALAERMLRRDGVVACFFGEGAFAEGEFHEAMNLAVLWRLPVLFLCENNYYAMGTALERSEAEVDLVRRAEGYGARAWGVDGMDVLAVHAAVTAAVAAARGDATPVFLDLRTYRFRAHSMFDPELYRDKSEVKAWTGLDPIAAFAARVERAGLAGATDFAAIDAAIRDEIAAAVATADAAPWEDVADLDRFVYAEAAR